MTRLLPMVCATMAAALPARGEGFGAAIGAGLGYGSSARQDATAPLLSLGASYGFPFFSAGIRGLLFAGSTASNAGGGSRIDPSGFQAWAALAEAALYLPRPNSAGVRLGVGLGKIIGLNCACEEVAPRTGHVAPVLLGSFFARVRVADHFRIMVEFAVLHFADVGNAYAPFSPPTSGQDAWSTAVLLSLEWLQR